ELSRILLKATGIKVEINGYTDNIGTSEANKALSQKRANRIRDYLVSKGVDTGRLTPIGRGETNFIASNATREGRQKNRRTELVFFR
ncbi:MAG: OmpA family protein, partial [Candidatus Zixiibacteriota bacterium]